MDYNKTMVLHENITSTGAGVWSKISFPNDYLVKKAWLIVRVQGAEADRTVTITNVGASTVYATLAPGTAAVGTVFEVSLEEDKRAFVGETVLEVRTVETDASAIYDLYVLIAHSE